MTSQEIRELREQIVQLRYYLEYQKSRSYINILFYPVNCLLFSLVNTVIDISFICLLVYLMIYNNSWIYSFMLATIIIYRNIGGLMLNINVSLIMTVIGIILLTYSFNAYTFSEEYNKSFNTHFQKYSYTDYDYDSTYNYTEKSDIEYIFNDSKFNNFKTNITKISLSYIDTIEYTIKNTTIFKNTIEFKDAFIDNYKDFQELIKTINTTIVYINETLHYISKAKPTELGKSMGTYFQEKTNNIKNMYSRMKYWASVPQIILRNQLKMKLIMQIK